MIGIPVTEKFTLDCYYLLCTAEFVLFYLYLIIVALEIDSRAQSDGELLASRGSAWSLAAHFTPAYAEATVLFCVAVFVLWVGKIVFDECSVAKTELGNHMYFNLLFRKKKKYIWERQ